MIFRRLIARSLRLATKDIRARYWAARKDGLEPGKSWKFAVES